MSVFEEYGAFKLSMNYILLFQGTQCQILWIFWKFTKVPSLVIFVDKDAHLGQLCRCTYVYILGKDHLFALSVVKPLHGKVISSLTDWHIFQMVQFSHPKSKKKKKIEKLYQSVCILIWKLLLCKHIWTIYSIKFETPYKISIFVLKFDHVHCNTCWCN